MGSTQDKQLVEALAAHNVEHPFTAGIFRSGAVDRTHLVHAGGRGKGREGRPRRAVGVVNELLGVPIKRPSLVQLLGDQASVGW